MTAYVTIPNGDIDQDSPLTQPLMTAMRDNPLAMFEGASGAPKFQGNAVARVSTGLTILTVTASAAQTATVGHGYLLLAVSTTSTSNVVAVQYTPTHYTGAVRLSCGHYMSAAGTSTLTLFKNGVSVAAFTTTGIGSANAIMRIVDVSLVPGDVFEWRHKSSTTAASSVIHEPTFQASEAYVQIIPSIKGSEV